MKGVKKNAKNANAKVLRNATWKGNTNTSDDASCAPLSFLVIKRCCTILLTPKPNVQGIVSQKKIVVSAYVLPTVRRVMP